MNVRQGFKMAAKSIFSNKVRSFLTMLGIIIGVAAVVIMVSVVQGQNQKIKE
ncbi:MAG: ABC transporter permease, partial [Clostridiales bacterium]|nr:ABC transporter permease [Clostridiales bacterium]